MAQLEETRSDFWEKNKKKSCYRIRTKRIRQVCAWSREPVGTRWTWTSTTLAQVSFTVRQKAWRRSEWSSQAGSVSGKHSRLSCCYGPVWDLQDASSAHSHVCPFDPGCDPWWTPAVLRCCWQSWKLLSFSSIRISLNQIRSHQIKSTQDITVFDPTFCGVY